VDEPADLKRRDNPLEAAVRGHQLTSGLIDESVSVPAQPAASAKFISVAYTSVSSDVPDADA